MLLDLPRGLSTREAASRLERVGPNRPVPEARGRRLRRWLGPLTDPMVALLLIAAPTYWAIGEERDAIIALVALVPIIAVGWVLEQRAERTLDRLRALTAPAPTAECMPTDWDISQAVTSDPETKEIIGRLGFALSGKTVHGEPESALLHQAVRAICRVHRRLLGLGI